MGKILAIDYGKKRIGIAETDDCKMIASGLTTIKNSSFFDFFTQFLIKNSVEELVVGSPKTLLGKFNFIEVQILFFLKKFSNRFPKIPIERIDERFTSKIAIQSLLFSGISKKKRKDKSLIDEISATLILQSYIDRKKNNFFSL